MHDAVPLHWSRTSHHLYPDTFRQQVTEHDTELDIWRSLSPMCRHVALPASLLATLLTSVRVI